MTRVPHAQGVNQAIRSVRAAAEKSLKALNQAASQRMAKGDYAKVEEFSGRGRAIREFQQEIDALRKRWREVCGGATVKSAGPATPLWKFFQPILQALVNLGGKERRQAIEAEVERLMGPTLLAADRLTMPGGHTRWQGMIRRARKSLVAEHWIQAGVGPYWQITDAGRRAAEKPIKGNAPEQDGP